MPPGRYVAGYQPDPYAIPVAPDADLSSYLAPVQYQDAYTVPTGAPAAAPPEPVATPPPTSTWGDMAQGNISYDSYAAPAPVQANDLYAAPAPGVDPLVNPEYLYGGDASRNLKALKDVYRTSTADPMAYLANGSLEAASREHPYTPPPTPPQQANDLYTMPPWVNNPTGRVYDQGSMGGREMVPGLGLKGLFGGGENDALPSVPAVYNNTVDQPYPYDPSTYRQAQAQAFLPGAPRTQASGSYTWASPADLPLNWGPTELAVYLDWFGRTYGLEHVEQERQRIEGLGHGDNWAFVANSALMPVDATRLNPVLATGSRFVGDEVWSVPAASPGLGRNPGGSIPAPLQANDPATLLSPSRLFELQASVLGLTGVPYPPPYMVANAERNAKRAMDRGFVKPMPWGPIPTGPHTGGIQSTVPGVRTSWTVPSPGLGGFVPWGYE